MIRPHSTATLCGQSALGQHSECKPKRCPYCRLLCKPIYRTNRRNPGLAVRLRAAAGDEEKKKIINKRDPRGAMTLAERVSVSLQKLRQRDLRQKNMFPVPDHWTQQTGKLSRGERRKLETYYKIVAKVNSMEQKTEQLSDDQLAERTGEFRKRVEDGESLESILPEAFALVREAAKRVSEMRHYDCQLIGGIVLHEGQIAEMDTGEGKTLVATLAVYLNALRYKEVHVVTVNEYLAKRDAQWMGKIYSLLGLSVAAIEEAMEQDEKKVAYQANVVYVTAQQLCFDYLGDWTATAPENVVLQDLNFAIVDEVDSILLDESRTPLILSAKAVQESERVELAAKICHDLVIDKKYGLVDKLAGLIETLNARGEEIYKGTIAATDSRCLMNAIGLLQTIIESTRLLKRSRLEIPKEVVQYLRDCKDNHAHFSSPAQFQLALELLNRFKPAIMEIAISKYDFQRKKVSLTQFGAKMFRIILELQGELPSGSSDVSLWENKAGENNSAPWGHYLTNALRVMEFFTKGTEYIVSEGRVILVDEATGRVRDKSRYEDGLHQALEAKEKLLQELENHQAGELPVTINPDNYTIASVTFQVFFRYYDKLAGMSGTAKVEQAEFFESYGLNVVRIPTHKPPRRTDHLPTIFTEPAMKLEALVYELAKNGVRPVLVGTNSVQESEFILSALKENWRFTGGQLDLHWDGESRFNSGKLLTLNARPEVAKAESQIIAQAGLPAMVTIATKMAGRGTDIVLGGNPRGLAERTIYQLVFSDLLKPGDRSLVGTSNIPLPQFSGSDPLDLLPVSLVANAHLAHLRSKASEDNLTSIDDVDRTMAGVMDTAERIKLLVMKELRPRMEKKWLRISDFDFERDIRGALAKVIGEHDEVLEKESGLRQKLIETAAYAWLWYEQQCELCGDQVRDAGGLLVIGMSIAESQRIEDQLRGRAGRQGDPGDSIMLYDLSDPMFRIWAFQGVAKVLKSNQQILNGKLEGYQAKVIIKMLRSIPEKMSTRSRRELREYDEVMEGFRSQLSYLRDTLMRGNHMQRTQMVYSWLQDMADELVDKFCSTTNKPSSWKVFGVRWETTFGADLCKMVPENLEECSSIEESIEMIFNPPNSTIALPVHGMRKRVTPDLAQAIGMSKEELDDLGLGLRLQSSPLSDRATANLKMLLVRVICFTKELQDDIRESLISGKPPARSAAQYFGGHNPRQIITIELRHALSLHKEILRQQDHESRKSIKGRNRKQLESLSVFLGELMIMLFEERKTQFIESLCQEDDHLLLDAQKSVEFQQKSLMLDLLDAYWANFLSVVKKLQASTSIRAFSRASPLEEFTIESSRQFSTTLEEYRKSAVLNLAAPQFNISPDSTFNMRRELINSMRRDAQVTQSSEIAADKTDSNTSGVDEDSENDKSRSNPSIL